MRAAMGLWLAAGSDDDRRPPVPAKSEQDRPATGSGRLWSDSTGRGEEFRPVGRLPGAWTTETT